jgi:hypothetical protein
MSLKQTKTRQDILDSLQNNLPAVVAEPVVQSIKSMLPSADDISVDVEEDYNFARDHIKKLIGTSDEAIATMHALAADAEHPRAFEVLAAMIKSAADMNSQLLTLQRDRKKLVIEPATPKSLTVGSNTTNNSIFVGTTTELQKFLKSQSETTVDV